MLKKLDDFFTSGWEFKDSEAVLKSKLQIINISILLSALGLIYGVSLNIYRGTSGYFIHVESLALFLDFVMLILLRYKRSLINPVATFITAQYTILFLFLVYFGQPDSLRHSWIYTYPLILFYFQGAKKGFYWLGVFVTMLLILPFQPFIESGYTFSQIIYMLIVFFITAAIVWFYQYKMDESNRLILKQQNMLKDFNKELEERVVFQTSQLQELNEQLENKVQEKLQEIVKRDKILEVQSKQAVMGEMISMIAHQWRQPLSAITLQISNLQFKRMLGEDISDKENDKVLTHISDTIIYLSDTIDDFLTYFSPNKDADEIEIHELLQKAINLALPKAKKSGVDIEVIKSQDIDVVTYINELVQVILNLLNNAIDALVESSKSEYKIKITTHLNEKNIIINVMDNADGISSDDLLHIFEPYFSTKGKNGTGLGLYMSQMIVQKQLEGSLEVESSKNGSTFIISIPKELS